MKLNPILPIFLFITWCFLPFFSQAQQSQIVRGTVIDGSSRQPLPGASIRIMQEEEILSGTLSDENGNFLIQNAPIGRHTVVCTFFGFEEWTSEYLYISSAREVVLEIEMTETTIEGEEVLISGVRQPDKPINDFSTVSTRSFTPEETRRYAASINDPGRMAMTFPGVRMSQDNNNDLIIRGNSAVGVLWRLEGIDIPSPNHFARRGSSGGGISIFSIGLLKNSDFSTGAFAAEYGNAISGVFDMQFRKGNNNSREHTLRASMIGLDLMTEGPIKKGKSSYLANYRYSTLGLLGSLGINVVGENVSNTFQDLSFNLYFPAGEKGHFTVFGIGGISKEITTAPRDTTMWEEFTDSQDNDFITTMGATGITWTRLLGERAYLRTILAASYQRIQWETDLLDTGFNPTLYEKQDFLEARFSGHIFYNVKFSNRLHMKAGIQMSNLFFDLKDQLLNLNTAVLRARIAGDGTTSLLQPYAQIRYLPTERLTLNLGVHGLYYFLNQTGAVDPRLALKYQFSQNTSFSLAYGLHSMVQPTGNYQTVLVDPQDFLVSRPNEDLGLNRAHHVVLGYNQNLPANFRVKLEAYYQSLFNIPVSANPANTYFILNERDGFATDSLVNEGSGTNIGLDMTLEKFFSQDYFILIAASLYDSKYTPLNGKTYNTRYNGRFSLSLMGGKEFPLKNNRTFEAGARFTYAGGFRYSPVDTVLSAIAGEAIYIQDQAFTQQIPDYYRLDLRFSFRKNKPKYDWLLSLDIQNATNRQNYRRQEYDPLQNQLIWRYGSSLLPVLGFEVHL